MRIPRDLWTLRGQNLNNGTKLKLIRHSFSSLVLVTIAINLMKKNGMSTGTSQSLKRPGTSVGVCVALWPRALELVSPLGENIKAF